MEVLVVLIKTVSFFNGSIMVHVEKGSQVKVDLDNSAARSPCGRWFDICSTAYQVFN